MEALALMAPDLCAETAACHGGIAPHLHSGPGVWNGTLSNIPPNYGDAAAWAFVALLVITFTALGLAIRAIRLRPPGLTPEQELIEEVHRNEDTIVNGPAESATPWERDPDWWRQ